MDSMIPAIQAQVRPATARGDAAAPAPAAESGAVTSGATTPRAVTPPPEVRPPQGAPEFSPGEDMAELLEGLSQRLNEFVQQNSRELEFQVNDEGGRVVILVRQSETGEVLRSIPPEEAQALAENLDSGASILFSQSA